MAQLIVGMTPALAAAVEEGTQTEGAARLRDLAESARLVLEPQTATGSRPDGALSDDPVWFSADASEGDPAGDLVEALMHVPGVTAAYVKPDVELP